MKVGIVVPMKELFKALDVSYEIMAYTETLATGKSVLFSLATSFFHLDDETPVSDYIDFLDANILLPEHSKIQRGEYGIYISCAVWPFVGRNLKRHLELQGIPFKFKREHDILGLNQWKESIRRVWDLRRIFSVAGTSWIAEDLESKKVLDVFKSFKERLNEIEDRETG